MPWPRSTTARSSRPTSIERLIFESSRDQSHPGRRVEGVGRGVWSRAEGIVSMRSWLWNGILALVALLILGLFGWLIRPVPDLDRDQVARMIEAGRYDEVEARLLDYLHAAPRDHSARMMLARI